MCHRRQNSRMLRRPIRRVEVERQPTARTSARARSPCPNSRRSRSRSAARTTPPPAHPSPSSSGPAAALANSGSRTSASVSASASLLGEPDREQHQPARDVLPHRRPVRVRAPLRHDLVVPHDRPGDQLREERHEREELQQPIDVPVAPAQVDQVGDLLEREEADAERQDDVERREPASRAARRRWRPRNSAYLQTPSTREVQHDAQHQHRAAARSRRYQRTISHTASVSPTSAGTKRQSQ